MTNRVARASTAPSLPGRARALDAETKRRAGIAAELRHDRMHGGVSLEDSRSLYVHHRQRKNRALLTHVTNVPMKFAGDFVPDFLLGNGAIAVFLSVKCVRTALCQRVRAVQFFRGAASSPRLV